MINERLWIDGVEVPLSKSLNPSFDRSITDIKNPDKREATHSRTTSLPNSKPLAKVFNHIYDINVVTLTFDPTKKTDVLYTVGGEVVLSGYIQLKDIVKIDNNDIEYKVVLYDEFANLFSSIKGKYLTDLTGLDIYDHLLSQDIQARSSGNDVAYTIFEDGILVPGEIGKGYIYALVDYGYSSDGVAFAVDQIGCSIYAYEYWDRVITQAGFTWEFTDSAFEDHFKHLIIPSSPSTFILDDAEIALRQFKADTAVLTSTGTNVSNDLSKEIYTVDDKVIFNNEIYDDGLNYNPLDGVFTAGSLGTYNFDSLIDVTATFKPDAGGSLESVGFVKFRTSLKHYIAADDVTVIVDEVEFKIKYEGFATGDRTTNVSPTYPDDQYFVDFLLAEIPREVEPPNRVLLSVSDLYLAAGDKVWVAWSANYDKDFPNYFRTAGEVFSGGEANISVYSGVFINKVSNLNSLEGDIFQVEKSIPRKVKQSDFLLNYIKEYNLFIVPDPNRSRHLFIAPRDSFYTSVVEDISDKVSIDKGITYKPVGALDAKSYLFKHKDDVDYLNTKYKSKWLETYGQREIISTNEFNEKEKKIEVMSSSTCLADNGTSSGRVLPTIIQVDDNGERITTKHNWRTLYYGGLKPCSLLWRHYFSGSEFYFPYYEYPYSGHFDDPFNATLDINFGLVREVFYEDSYADIQITDNNLYNKYHSKYIREITDKDSKIVHCYVNMTPYDWKSWTFDKLYYFDNAYFRLQNVNGYNPTSEELTKCVFLKLKEVSPFKPRVRTATGSGADFDPEFDDGGGGGGEVESTESTPLKSIRFANKEDGNNYRLTNTVNGNDNFISKQAYNVNITGDDNRVFSGSNGVVLINSNSNEIKPNLTDVTLINTNGVVVSESNTTYIDGQIVEATTDFQSGFYQIELGEEFTIEENKQMTNWNKLTNNGTLNINGQLILK